MAKSQLEAKTPILFSLFFWVTFLVTEIMVSYLDILRCKYRDKGFLNGFSCNRVMRSWPLPPFNPHSSELESLVLSMWSSNSSKLLNLSFRSRVFLHLQSQPIGQWGLELVLLLKTRIWHAWNLSFLNSHQNELPIAFPSFSFSTLPPSTLPCWYYLDDWASAWGTCRGL